MTSTFSNKQPSGARESNAGDDFHLIWAARRCLSLLQPDSELQAIGLEGPDPTEARLIDPDGGKLLGIDLAEYYGGNDMFSAKKVVFSQLKYSTRQPKKNWTGANLSKGKGTKGKGSGSIVHRMAQEFAAYCEYYSQAEIRDKLTLSLVSNRPCSDKLRRALSQIGSTGEYSDLLDSLKRTSKNEIKRLRDGVVVLNDPQFVDFLQVLDFSKCGEGSRCEQDLALKRGIRVHGFFDVLGQYNRLKVELNRLVMPETQEWETISKHHVLSFLNVQSAERLFPAPPQLKKLDSPVPRAQEVTVAERLRAGNDATICLHGRGGVGKTTFVQALSKHLPEGSVCIVYDCYGGGTYLNRSKLRHGYSRAIRQICNELASRVCSAMLLEDPGPQADSLEVLQQRLELSWEILRAEHPDAIICIIIDAADNSLHASTHRGGESFILGLLDLALPDGCRLVLTARTGRLDDLGLPRRVTPIEIEPFEIEDTRQNLARYDLVGLSEDDISEFHELTNHIPRVQDYALERSDNDVKEAIILLKPGGMSLDGIIDGMLNEACLKLGDQGIDREVFPVMASLPRPIPLRFLSELAGLQEDAAKDFCNDLSPGIWMNGGEVGFNDEDFEGRLNERYGDVDVSQRIAEVFLEHASTDQYAAINLADALVKAGREDELVEMVLSNNALEAVTDPLRRTEVSTRRSLLALKSAVQEGDRPLQLRLLVVMAAATKTDAAVRSALQNNADLACKFGDVRTVQELFSTQADGPYWKAMSHLQCAALFSRNDETCDLVESHVNGANAAISHFFKTPEDQREREEFQVEDIADLTEALLRTQGVPAAVRDIGRWRPSSAFKIAQVLTDRLFASEGEDAFELLAELTSSSFHRRSFFTHALLAVIHSAMKYSLTPPESWVQQAVDFWTRFADRKSISKPERPLPESLIKQGISLCEAAILAGQDMDRIRKLLVLFVPSIPIHEPRYLSYSEDGYSNGSEPFDRHLRYRALQTALAGDDLDSSDESLLPENLRGDDLDPYNESVLSENLRGNERKKKEKKKQTRRTFQCYYATLFPSYKLRAKGIVGSLDTTDLPDRISAALHAKPRDPRFLDQGQFFDADFRKAELLTDAVIRSASDPSGSFRKISEHYASKGWVRLAKIVVQRAVSCPSLHGEAIRFTEGVANNIKQEPPPAEEQMDSFFTCCRLVGRIDRELEKRYFKQAERAASEIDNDAFHQLQFLTALARRARVDAPNLSEPLLAEQFAQVIEDCYHRLGTDERKSWKEYHWGVAHLCPSVGMASIMRWDQRGLECVDGSLLPFLDTCVENGTLPLEASIAFGVFSNYFDQESVEIALRGLGRLRDSGVSNQRLNTAGDILLDDTTRLAPLDQRRRLTKHVLEWMSENGLGHLRCALEAQRYIGQIEESVEDVGNQYGAPSLSGIAPKRVAIEELDLGQFLNGRDMCSGEQLAQLFIEFDGFAQENSIWERQREAMRHLMRHARKRIVPANFCQHLDALIQVDIGVSVFGGVLDLIEDAVTEWNYHPMVDQWTEALPERMVQNRRDEVVHYSDVPNTVTIGRIAACSSQEETAVYESLLGSLSEHSDAASSGLCYGIAGGLIPSLADGQALDLLREFVPAMRANVSRDDLACRDIDVSGVPDGSEDLLAVTLWFLFGHPDKKVRWRAAHAARRLVRLGRHEIVERLATWLSRGQEHPFSMPETTFYWLSARQWFFILMDRLSTENPSAILPLAEIIAQEAIEPETPHVITMHFAKRAALRLAEMNPCPYSPERLKALYASLQPTWGTQEDLDNAPQDNYRSSCTGGFNFDLTDTLPYWYAPAGGVFGIRQDEFCDMASRWICGQWRIPPQIWNSDWVHKGQFGQRDWGLFSNGHGSDPSVEDLRRYAEYHGMCCTMGELLRDWTVLPSRWEYEDGEPHPWQEWIGGWDLRQPDSWLADSRQRTPLDKWFWTNSDEQWDDDWQDNAPAEYFKEMIGLAGETPSHIVIAGHIDRDQRDSGEDVRISSALVSPETSQALLMALSECQNPHDYRIPEEGDESMEVDECLVDGTKLHLSGWYRSLEGEGGVDEKDPLRYSHDRKPFVPGTLVCQWASDQGLNVSEVAEIEQWNDCPQRDQTFYFNTQGTRLKIRYDMLLQFLQYAQSSLLIECAVGRRVDRDYSEKGKRNVTHETIFLIHADGTMHDRRGSSWSW